MKKKKICLRGLADILNERELKNVLGGSDINETAGNCCVTGTVVHENGQHIYYNICGVTINYYFDILNEFVVESGFSVNCA
jgi:hypothetical protein